jgi:hypothetical protein
MENCLFSIHPNLAFTEALRALLHCSRASFLFDCVRLCSLEYNGIAVSLAVTTQKGEQNRQATDSYVHNVSKVHDMRLTPRFLLINCAERLRNMCR